jgi:ribosomal protein S18 acetylase RimI-like enzyme
MTAIVALTEAKRGLSVRLGALHRGHRARIIEILEATGSFRDDEIAVALELFDETFATQARAPFDPGAGVESYEFIGAFSSSKGHSPRGFAAQGDNELIGYACYGATPGTLGTYDLYWIAVDPEHQGEGGGSRLLDEVERRLNEREARLLVVETSSRTDYESTRRFYERRNYHEYSRLSDFYASGDDRLIYAKKLIGR